MAKTKPHKFTIYLLKGEHKPPALADGLIRGYASEEAPEIQTHHPDHGMKAWHILKNLHGNPPSWATFHSIGDVRAQSAQCVFFIPFPIDGGKYRVAAICYGHSRHFLKKEKLVKDFGFRTGLNLIDKEQIRRTSVNQPSDYSKKKETQTSRNANLATHDFKEYTDMLKGGTGKVQADYKEKWGSTVSFTDQSVTLSLHIEEREIPNKLSALFSIFQKEDYKEKFPECGKFRAVLDEDKILELDQKLVAALNMRDENVFFDFPNIIYQENFDHFQIALKGKKKGIENLDDCPTIEDIYREFLKEGFSFNEEFLENVRVRIKNGDGVTVADENLHSCLVWDTSFHSEKYHLSGGDWHLIDGDFSSKISKDADAIYAEKIADQHTPEHFGVRKHGSEEAYNIALSEAWGARLLDKKLIYFAKKHRIELCDVFVKEDESKYHLVHVKRMHGSSSSLSHLFTQGAVSLAAINSDDPDIMDSINKAVDEFDRDRKVVVHYLIIRKGANRILPFFAQVALTDAVDKIKERGGDPFYTVVNEEDG